MQKSIYLLVSEFLPEVGHHVTQLCCADEAVTIFVENPEGLPDFFFTKIGDVLEKLNFLLDRDAN